MDQLITWCSASSVQQLKRPLIRECNSHFLYSRVQLGECMKTVIHADYPEQWPLLLSSVDVNLKSRDQQRVYGALYALRILTKKYEYVFRAHHVLHASILKYCAALWNFLCTEGLLLQSSLQS